MTVNGLILPAPFVAAAQQGMFRRERGSWKLLRDVDAWGLPLETEMGEVFEEETRIVQKTERVAQDFPPEEFDGPDVSENLPGFIPYVTDFSKIVCFGVSGAGDPFCFDFRSALQSPEVIWWEDAFWRRIAPDWPSFAALFDLAEQTSQAV